MVEIPHTVAHIDPDWLRASACPADAAAFANLNAVRAERLAEGVGMATDIYRLHLDHGRGAATGPASLVAKLPSSSPEVREVARGWGLYQREVLFYRNIAASAGVRVPKAYVAEFDPKTHGYVLVMEDLSPAIGGDRAIGLPLEHARLALNGIADLHSSWWNRPELAALEATLHPFGEGSWVGTGERLAAAWPIFEPFLAVRASPTLRRIGARMSAVIEPLMIDMARGSRTLCHGDFHADNLMFAPRDGGTVLVTVDWQAPLQARGAVDVGNLLSMSVTTDLRRAHEADLLRAYHDKLLAGGVSGYVYDAFLHDYRRSLLIGFFYVIQTAAVVDLTYSRTEALFDSGVRRLDAAVQDHGLEQFVA
jgi:hypothetical protein